MNFFYATESDSLGPVSITELERLLNENKISLDTFVIEENGSKWKPLSHIIGTKNDKKPAREMNAGTVFTIKHTGPLSIQPVPVKKVAPNALILYDYGKMPDGSQRKVLIMGKDVIPSTPEEALQQYIPAQETRIAEIKKILRQEEEKLAEAKTLLNKKASKLPKTNPQNPKTA